MKFQYHIVWLYLNRKFYNYNIKNEDLFTFHLFFLLKNYAKIYFNKIKILDKK